MRSFVSYDLIATSITRRIYLGSRVGGTGNQSPVPSRKQIPNLWTDLLSLLVVDAMMVVVVIR
ncbi:uncharacterized protein BO97DRAFT_406449 [Aspergillus homomorphus CBS 101889]|uniref:Uncharacterized protein n=1 Tax=Aspergillus homomorphus (strain CBS 101889) TaxID=1450537 RepID=A0A395HWL9_ASPHC|nr:hypothetical protein BO97DRAFT_406449 [Aspergillus homomorphus CBS 101889]RAL11248.1 hypothetical protein BO97DRAFT_406449 [Aspergillus homomorphus CBS 101889]